MQKCCLEEDAIKDIKHKHKMYLFYSRAYVVVDRVPSVEGLIHYELNSPSYELWGLVKRKTRTDDKHH